jgi:hypothetical protein
MNFPLAFGSGRELDNIVYMVRHGNKMLIKLEVIEASCLHLLTHSVSGKIRVIHNTITHFLIADADKSEISYSESPDA